MRDITYVALAFSVVLLALCIALCSTKKSKVNLAEDELPGMHTATAIDADHISTDARMPSHGDTKSAKESEM